MLTQLITPPTVADSIVTARRVAVFAFIVVVVAVIVVTRADFVVNAADVLFVVNSVVVRVFSRKPTGVDVFSDYRVDCVAVSCIS
jgi:hypothetical protein